MSLLNIGDLSLDGKQPITPKKPTSERRNNKAPRHKSGERFVQGPIPYNWMAKASNIGGKGATVSIALLIWFRSGIEQQSNKVRLTRKDLQEFGINRNALYRGLSNLEKAGLISLARKKGARPFITILGVSSED
jgi:hypothetical protein